MSIIRRLVCFLFIVACAANCKAGGCARPASPAIACRYMPATAVSFFTGKKDKLTEQSPVWHPFITVSPLSFMLEPGGATFYTLHTFFSSRDNGISYQAIQAWGIVAGLKAKMLFPVHYFW